jgi:hypothetical protein
MEPNVDSLAEQRQAKVPHETDKFKNFYCNVQFCVGHGRDI